MKNLILSLLLLFTFNTAVAFEITYLGEFIQNGKSMEVGKLTDEAVAINQYLSVVPKAFPATDGLDEAGNLQCWYMVDMEKDFKAMISSVPLKVGKGAELAEQSPFIQEVTREADKQGGLEQLARECVERQTEGRNVY